MTSLYETTLPGCSEEDLLKWWESRVIADKATLCISGAEFASNVDAKRWFESNLEEGEARAVPLGDFRVIFDRTKTGIRLREKVSKLKDSLVTLDLDTINRVRSGRAVTKGCVNCGSQIAVDYIGLTEDRHTDSGRPQALYCPICGKMYLPSFRERERFDTLQEQLTRARSDYNRSRSDYDERHKDQGYWYVLANVRRT